MKPPSQRWPSFPGLWNHSHTVLVEKKSSPSSARASCVSACPTAFLSLSLLPHNTCRARMHLLCSFPLMLGLLMNAPRVVLSPIWTASRSTLSQLILLISFQFIYTYLALETQHGICVLIGDLSILHTWSHLLTHLCPFWLLNSLLSKSPGHLHQVVLHPFCIQPAITTEFCFLEKVSASGWAEIHKVLVVPFLSSLGPLKGSLAIKWVDCSLFALFSKIDAHALHHLLLGHRNLEQDKTQNRSCNIQLLTDFQKSAIHRPCP